MSITGLSQSAIYSHYSHQDAGASAAAVGKVIELVTRKADDASETSLKIWCDTTITGRRLVCSEPDRGRSSAQ